MLAESLTQKISAAALSVVFEDLPHAVIDKAKSLIADTLLVAAPGRGLASSIALRQTLAGSSGQSRVWFDERRQTHSAMDATFINTLHCAALDYDSINRAVHADLVTLPPAWAVAEHCERSPRQLLTAYVVASEIVSRLSRCATGVSKGWSGTSIYGGIGAALASGLLMRLNAEQLTQALGLAAGQAAGTQQANVEQTLAKRLQPAFAARNGVFAALLAQAGATAPNLALEGKFGLRALYQPADDGPLLDAWGSRWQFLDTAIKRFPVCACSHAAIEALLNLREKVGFDADQIVEIVAKISPFMSRLVGGDFNLLGDLQVLAQFNLRYHLACVLVRGSITLADLAPQALHDAAIAAVIPHIRLIIDPDNQNELAPASVSITLNDGRSYHEVCSVMPGSPQLPMTAQQRLHKTNECATYTQPLLSDLKLQRLLDAVDGFPELGELQYVWGES